MVGIQSGTLDFTRFEAPISMSSPRTSMREGVKKPLTTANCGGDLGHVDEPGDEGEQGYHRPFGVMECCRKTKGASVLPTDAPWNSGSGDGGCQRDDTFHLPSADTVTYPCCGSRSTPFWSAAEVCRTICGAPFAGVQMTVPGASTKS